MIDGIDGLDNIVAAETVLSEVDGQAGRLVIRGYSVEELAGRTTYEAAAHLLLDGFFDDLPADLAPAIGAARAEVFAHVAALDATLLALTPMEAMRALTARLAGLAAHHRGGEHGRGGDQAQRDSQVVAVRQPRG